MAYATETYDDETVATENYYLAEDADAENLKIKEENYERELHTDDFGADAESAAEKFREEKEEKIPENEERFAFFENDENYYLKVKAELDGIFETNPPEPALEKTLPESKWARINYGTDKYYVVGLVYEKNTPKYICYGVRAAYSEYPPKELAGYCSFIPLSVFEMRGNGFWMMFQDAKTGECVTYALKRLPYFSASAV